MNHSLNASSYPSGSIVRIIKRSACKDPVRQPTSWSNWVPGQLNPGSLPVDYELRGILVGVIRIGGVITVRRTHRNGVKVPGYFTSTVIRAIHNDGRVETLNSVYEIALIS